MKKLFFTLVIVLAAVAASAQTVAKNSAGKAVKVFTMLYAESDDGFVNVRSVPNGKVIAQINSVMYGLGDAMLLENGNWCKVKTTNGKIGYANSRFLGSMTWYKGNGKRVLVAKANCPLYREDFGKEPAGARRGKPMFRLTEGTIIADEYEYDKRSDCYVLVSAHDGIFIPRKYCVEKTM